MKCTFQAHRQIYMTHTQIYLFWWTLKLTEVVWLVPLTMEAVIIILQSFPTGNSEDRPTDWVPNGPDWRKMTPGPSTQKSCIIISRCFTEFYFYQRLGHLTLVTLYETVPHIVEKDPQWVALFFFFFNFVIKERQLLVW